MDERIRRLVLSQPVPMKLATALYLAPDLSVNQTPSRVLNARRNGCPSLDPEDMSPVLIRVLTLACHGYTVEEIARRMHYAPASIRDKLKALLGIFGARNRAHLTALAVAQGYVDMTLAAYPV